MEPVAVGKAQERLEVVADALAKAQLGAAVADVQVVDRIDELVLEDQQRRPVEMGDQEEQQKLVSELGEDAADLVAEVGGVRLAHRHQGTARADQPGIGSGVGIRPVAIVAVARLEPRHRRIPPRERVARTERIDQSQTDEILSAEGPGSSSTLL